MTLTKKQKKEILDRSFNYDDIITRLGISEVKQKDKFLKMSGWLGKKGHQTIAETLKPKKPAPLVLKMLLRKEVLPEYVIHGITQHFCQDFLERIENEGVLIDPIYTQLMKIKSSWTNLNCSLGILKQAQREAVNLLGLSHRFENKLMVAAAAAIHATMHDNARIGVLSLFEVIDGVYPKELDARYEHLKAVLSVN